MPSESASRPSSSRPSAPSGAGASDPLPAALARWLLYLGLAALLGATFVAYAITAEPSRALTRLAVIGWVAAALGTIAVIAVQWVDADAAFSAIVASSIGIGALARVLIIAATWLAVAVLARRPPAVRAPLAGLAAALAAVAMLVDVLTGHAASGPTSPVQVLAQWLHGLGAAIWIGGLAALLLAIRGQADEAKARCRPPVLDVGRGRPGRSSPCPACCAPSRRSAASTRSSPPTQGGS